MKDDSKRMFREFGSTNLENEVFPPKNINLTNLEMKVIIIDITLNGRPNSEYTDIMVHV